MQMSLAQLTDLTGLDVLDHVEREMTVPVLDEPQAQGDLLVVPQRLLADAVGLPPDADAWREVPASGIELLRSGRGGNPHTLAADAGTCRWTAEVHDASGLAVGALHAQAPAYLIHPEHGGSGIAPGTYVVRRQREGTGNLALAGRRRTRLGIRLVAD